VATVLRDGIEVPLPGVAEDEPVTREESLRVVLLKNVQDWAERSRRRRRRRSCRSQLDVCLEAWWPHAVAWCAHGDATLDHLVITAGGAGPLKLHIACGAILQTVFALHFDVMWRWWW
jgi:hypothetical protein